MVAAATQRPEDRFAGRVVLLGASNLALGLPTVVETARRAWHPPLDILGAIGHGRSYGTETRVFGRRLPSILSCGLWETLESSKPLPTAALVTDIGNDLAYGSSPDQIIEWVEHCLERLADHVERLVVTRLPIESIDAASSWKFQLLRRVLFPGARIDRARIVLEANAINRWLMSCANRFRAYVIHPDFDWYAWDPIHIARSRREVAWQKILSPWADGRSPQPNRPTYARSRAVRRARPLQWHRFGFPRRCPQPSVQLNDGTAISLF